MSTPRHTGARPKQRRRFGVRVTLTVEFDREVDGRWIADVPELPGVLVYGRTKREAREKVQALAVEVLAEEVRRGRRVLFRAA